MKTQKIAFIFPLIFIYYEILLKLFGELPAGNVLPLLFFTIFAGLLFGSVTFLIPKKLIRFLYAEITLFLFSVLFIVECFVGKVFQTFMTPASMLSAAGNVADDFSSEVITTITAEWYIILIYLIPVILIASLYKKCFFDSHIRMRPFIVTFLLALVLLISGHFTASRNSVYEEEYQFDRSMRTLGLFTTFSTEIRHTIFGTSTDEFTVIETTAPVEETEEVVFEPNTMDIDFAALAGTASNSAVADLDTYMAAQRGTMQNEYTGLFKGKNLILVTAEAFSNYAVSEELTPTLYRMMHNGFYFSDYYQPAWGGSTSTGEYSILMGLIPTDGVKSIRKTEGHNLYLTIGNQLLREGYHSAAYHNNSYTYYSRNTTHTNLGYPTFMGMGNGMEAGVDNCWPQSDHEMINFTVPQYIDQQPFSIYYMTVSGHCGYSYGGNAMSKKNWEAVQSVEASDTIKAYLASQLELEYAMTDLIAQLDAAGILNDTVICISSDHYPYGLEAGETWGNTISYLPELYGCSESDLRNKFVQDRNGWILWSGALENDLKDYAKEISEPTYSLDILPTLSNLFGVEYDSRLLVGRDVFSTEEALVIWPDYSFKTSKVSYNAETGALISADGTEIAESYVARIKAIVKNKYNLSKTTLENDYWNHVFTK